MGSWDELMNYDAPPREALGDSTNQTQHFCANETDNVSTFLVPSLGPLGLDGRILHMASP